MLVGAWCGHASAFEIARADARFQDKEFRVSLELVLDAPAERVQAVLRDYDNYPQLHDSILESKVLARDDVATLRLYTKLRACAGLFCRTVRRVERVHESSFELLAVVAPEESDVESGRTQTVLQTLDGRTRVQYQTSVAPKFWVPTLIGRPLMLRALRQASLDLFRSIERHAQGPAT